MRLAIVNPISQTSPNRWSPPKVESNAQSIAVQLARELKAAGHEPVVFMADAYVPSQHDEGVVTRYLPALTTPLTPPAQLPWMPSLAKEIRAGHFNAVISSEVFQWSTLALAEGRGLPPLFVWHEADDYQRFLRSVPARAYYATAGRAVIHRAAGFMPRSERAHDFLMRIGVPEERIGPEVPNGFDANTFYAQRELRDRVPLVLFVGSLIERKNPFLVVRAMGHVLKQRPDAMLLMKGFGNQEGDLRRLAHEMGIGSNVEFNTRRSSHTEMSRIYNRAWVGAFPTFRDFATLSPIEAVACGVPVVLSRRLFSTQFLSDHGCGIGTSDDDVEFAQAILSQIEDFGSAGLPDESIVPIVNRFSLQHCARSLADYVARVIS